MKLIYKWIYRSYRQASGLSYWVRRRFTPVGMCVASAAFISIVVGLDAQNTVTYQVFVMLTVIMIMAFASCWNFRARFSATRNLPRFGTVGQTVTYAVSVKNLTGEVQKGLTLLEDSADPRPTFHQWLAFKLSENRKVSAFSITQRRPNPFRIAEIKNAEIPAIPGRGETDALVEITPLRRGVLRFSGVTVARMDPFGLFRSFIRTPASDQMLILPKRYPLASVPLPGMMKYQENGVALAANIGRSEEFVALREYRRGDPVRHIHWRSWAKVGKPIVKEFEDEFFVRHALVLDTFTDEPYSELLEEAVSVAASFACTMLTQESLLDLLFVGSETYCFTAGRGLAHADQMLEILASVQACADKPFSVLENLVLNHASAVSGVICVMQSWDPARQDFVKKLRVLDLPVIVLVVTHQEAEDLDPGPMRDLPENFRVLKIGKIQEELVKLGG